MAPYTKTYLSQIKNEDIDAKRNEYLFPLPSFLEKKILPMLNNPVDIIMVHLMFNFFVLVYPMAFVIFKFATSSLTWWGHLLVAVYALVQAFTMYPRYALMLHYSSHRPLFKEEYNFLNYINPYFLSPICGFYLGIGYHLHHVMMHHTENNSGFDISETETYVRNSWLEFLRYYVTFLFGMIVYPSYYALHVGRYDFALIHTTAVSSWFFIFSLLWKINPVGTWWVLGFPAVLMTFLLSFGNWSQHILVDPDRSTKNHALTYNCMNHWENQRLFNDGYHVQHHINGPLHWSKLPEYFMSNLDSYAHNDGILFRGIHFFDVGVMVMFGQWDKLVEHYVYVDGGKDYSKEDLIKMFKHRLQPVHKKK